MENDSPNEYLLQYPDDWLVAESTDDTQIGLNLNSGWIYLPAAPELNMWVTGFQLRWQSCMPVGVLGLPCA